MNSTELEWRLHLEYKSYCLLFGFELLIYRWKKLLFTFLIYSADTIMLLMKNSEFIFEFS